MAATSKRNRGSASRDCKMTAQEYHELIGKHKHIEHKALRQEVANEFAQITQQTSTEHLETTKELLNPPQPPPIPLESSRLNDQGFRASAPWPRLSVIQRAAHMLHQSAYEMDVVEGFLQSIKVPQIQIDIAKEVAHLMEESERYWKKVHSLSTATSSRYEGRYNVATRKYALEKVSWSLQLAMTLMDFHADHIVDIVYKKAFWARDFEAVDQALDASPRRKDRSVASSYGSERTTTEYGTSGYFEATEDEEDAELEFDSEDQGGAVRTDSGSDGVGALMSKAERKEIDRKMKEQTGQSLDSLFSDMFKDLGGGDKAVAFAKGFQVDLEESNDGSFDVEEDGLGEVDREIVDNFDADYPRLARGVIESVYIEEEKNVEATKCRLDMLDAQSFTNFTEE